jgi:plastocyanin
VSERQRIRGRGAIGALGVVGALMAAGVVAERAPAADARVHTVTIENMRFEPQVLTVRRGDRVVWVNKDLFPHTSTAAARAFDSQSIPPAASWTFVAGKTGSYAYGCAFHPAMTGRLIVQ